ncbi:hypothetical protein JTB14_008787 [Gonioctena quinquepunctata]|nr:hypothetical protein JTB14_008787 [Gonioctena quinquepunctata]
MLRKKNPTKPNATVKGWELDKDNTFKLKWIDSPQLPHLVQDAVFESEADDDQDDEIDESESNENDSDENDEKDEDDENDENVMRM